MRGPVVSVDVGMDRRWLEEQARHDPLAHAYALWDLDHAPDRAEFRLLREGGVPVAYLLIWRGAPAAPMVHWVGPTEATPLLDVLPPRPLIAVVPESLGPRVKTLRGPARVYPVLIMRRDRPPPVASPPDGRVRRLGPSDSDRLHAFAAGQDAWIARAYAATDLTGTSAVSDWVWGAFEGDALVGVARSQVRRPGVWILNGIFVDEAHRGRGLGRGLTAAAAEAAETDGAVAALYCSEANLPAVRAYEAIGFRTAERRAWVDAGVDRAP